MSESISLAVPDVFDDPAPRGDGVVELGARLDDWLDANAEELAPLRVVHSESLDQISVARELQSTLYAAGWAQCGWPEEIGGSGGNILHRAMVCERLTQRGYATFAMFEHLEILLPALLRFARPGLVASVGPEFLSGRSAWSQGFSEPEAGSDLANLRTAARPVGDGYVLDGRKIWTSWAVHADRCLVLARIGSSEYRHRNLTMFVVDLQAPGVTVNPIRQATGADELAEITFDGVTVDEASIVGERDGGWAVALYVLLHERGTFTWFRHCVLLARLRRLLQAGLAERTAPQQLGELAADFVSVRAAAIDAMRDTVLGRGSLPRVSACKLQLSTVEQQLYDLSVSAFGPELVLGVLPDDLGRVTQQEYQFSRVVGIYGGSREMQLNAIARKVLGL